MCPASIDTLCLQLVLSYVSRVFSSQIFLHFQFFFMENFYAKSKSRLILMNAINYLGGNKQGTAEFFKATGILQAQKKKKTPNLHANIFSVPCSCEIALIIKIFLAGQHSSSRSFHALYKSLGTTTTASHQYTWNSKNQVTIQVICHWGHFLSSQIFWNTTEM